jgi:hypothetical protein
MALGPHRVHDGLDVIDPLLECGQAVHRVRQTDTPHVDKDQTPELGESPEGPIRRREFPQQVDVARPVEGNHDVERSVALDLVRDLEPTAVDVADGSLRRHDRILGPQGHAPRCFVHT